MHGPSEQSSNSDGSRAEDFQLTEEVSSEVPYHSSLRASNATHGRSTSPRQTDIHLPPELTQLAPVCTKPHRSIDCIDFKSSINWLQSQATNVGHTQINDVFPSDGLTNFFPLHTLELAARTSHLTSGIVCRPPTYERGTVWPTSGLL
jgi:hypothetical protein